MPDPHPHFKLPTEIELVELLPAYSQISFLAQGGMAAVYRAVQTSLDRPVAIKILPREYGQDEAFRIRFEAEAKTMAKLNHPNLVGIYEFGEIDELLYLVMEFVEGQSLYDYAYGKTLDDVEAVEMTLAVADGLAHAHEVQVLHRDIKPSNILLNEKNVPKLGDFGLANAGERAEGDKLLFGTPGYTSPEVMAHPEHFDERADVFALGVLLHELLVGELPRTPYQTPSRLAGCDPRIDNVIRKALSLDPKQRHPSAVSLAEDLGQLLFQLKTQGRRKLTTAATRKPAAPATVQIARPILATVAPAETRRVALSPAPAQGTPPPTPPVPPTPPAAVAKDSHDWHLYRNLVIIAGLSVAIWGAWNVMKTKQETTDVQNAEILRQQGLKKAKGTANQQAAQTATSDTAANPSLPSTTPSQSHETPDPALIVETPSPLEQLDKLRPVLAKGERGKYPDGTVSRSDSHFFFIEEPMTWHQAIHFAEKHGAHLPVLRKDSDLRWLSSKKPSDGEMWVGAGAISRDDWAWFDETPFEHRKPSITIGTAGVLNDIGILKSAQPSRKLPFFIQWNDDGRNLATRAEMLSRYKKSSGKRVPSWPPGVLSHKDRRYYIIAEELSHSKAIMLAQEAGGHLAVASDKLEAAFLADAATDSGLDQLWLGGFQKEKNWVWRTGESWSFANWAEDEPVADEAATSLILTAQGWKASNPGTPTAGYIIEWSDDLKNASAQAADPDDPKSVDLSELRTTAKNLILREQAVCVKQLKDNTIALGMYLRQWVRNLPSSQNARYAPAVSKYLATIDQSTGRMPVPNKKGMLRLPIAGAEILNRHYEKQISIDEQLFTTAEKFRVAYIRKLQEEKASLEASGQLLKTAEIDAEIEKLGLNGKSFLKALEIEQGP